MRELVGIEIDEALTHPDLLGPVVHGAAWAPWLAFLKSVYGCPLNDEVAEIYESCTSRKKRLLASIPPGRATDIPDHVFRRLLSRQAFCLIFAPQALR